MRRSIDDHPQAEADIPPGVDDAVAMTWAVAVCDDYDDSQPRVVLTLEEAGRAGAGLVAHLRPTSARRLQAALAAGLREVGEGPSR